MSLQINDTSATTSDGHVEPVKGPVVDEDSLPISGSWAEGLRAKYKELASATEEFPVPGWDEIILVIRQPSSRRELYDGLRNEQFIERFTVAVKLSDEHGEFSELPGGWAALAKVMGAPADATIGEVIRKILANPLRLDSFTEKILAWCAGRIDRMEQALGE